MCTVVAGLRVCAALCIPGIGGVQPLPRPDQWLPADHVSKRVASPALYAAHW